MRTRIVLLAAACVLSATAAAASAAAQQEGPHCQGRMGSDLGFRHFAVNGSAFVDNGYLSFGAEPRLSGIDPAGPAAGRLREGDVLVAVDGRLITTRAAALRLWQARPGETVNLTVRRDGRRVVAPIVVGGVCEPTPPPALPAAPTGPMSAVCHGAGRPTTLMVTGDESIVLAASWTARAVRL